MDPHNFIARAGAQRWLGIAEKLLMGNDLVGSKTFAIRAKESDPRLEAADQILAVADTLLAAEKRLVGPNGSQQPDFYAILQVVRFLHDPEHIAAQYQRLAFALNPTRNRFPFANQAFQLLNDAYAVLSNPMRKSLYDSDLEQQNLHINGLGFSIDEQHHQQQHQHNFFSINPHEQSRVSQAHPQQLHQHNFLSVRAPAVPVREPEQMFRHRDHENLFQQQPQPFTITVVPQQQMRQPSMQQTSPAGPPQGLFSWPQAPPPVPPMSQMQQPVQQEVPLVQVSSNVNSNNDVREEGTETEAGDENVDDSPSFWTTCPYCLYMYEYPKDYIDCVLRCNTCKRAFQAVQISSPPQISDDQESYYYCWGFFPLAISMSHLQANKGSSQTNSNWSPFSPMYDVTSHVKDRLNENNNNNNNNNDEDDEQNNNDDNTNNEDHLNEEAPKKNVFANKYLGPTIYIDDETDDIFEGISEPSEDDDTDLEWDTTEKKAKRMKKERVKDARNGSKRNPSSVRLSKKSSGVTTRRQSVRAAKEMGRLDLNVEFNNNEGDEPAARAGSGNRGNGQGDGDNIEGIGFFEGLDEFFSSLPILSVVNDDKVKAA